MNQRLLIVVFTALVFGAGFGAHVWIAGEPTVPPPPGTLGTEFTHGAGTPATPAAAADPKNAKPGTKTDQPFDRPKLVSEIGRYSSQIKTYQTRLDELDADFDRQFIPLLTPKQQDLYKALLQRWAERRAKGQAAIAAETSPLSDEQIFRLQRMPLMGVLSSVSISMRYDRLNEELKFDEAQRAQVNNLLRLRREKFLALVDDTPPPSITLTQLAAHPEKLGAEAEPPKSDK